MRILLAQTEWELKGLDVSYAPSRFDLGVSGSLYADRSQSQSRGCRMRGHLEIAITCVLPPPLRLVPEPVLRGVAESVRSSRLASSKIAPKSGSWFLKAGPKQCNAGSVEAGGEDEAGR